MSENAKCLECGHPMQFVKKVESVPYDDGFLVHDYLEWYCPWCEKTQRFGTPPIYPYDEK